MHTETTLRLLEESVTSYGTLMRRFQSKTCVALKARELPREVAKQHRKKAADQLRRAQNGATVGPRKPSKSEARAANDLADPDDNLGKEYNLARYKYHAIGDWVANIRRFGTLDNYSTQTVCRDLSLQVMRDISSTEFHPFTFG